MEQHLAKQNLGRVEVLVMLAGPAVRHHPQCRLANLDTPIFAKLWGSKPHATWRLVRVPEGTAVLAYLNLAKYGVVIALRLLPEVSKLCSTFPLSGMKFY